MTIVYVFHFKGLRCGLLCSQGKSIHAICIQQSIIFFPTLNLLDLPQRDVLADPKFARFASLTTEELQNRDDFYEHLMNMPIQGDPVDSPGGFFDRTLMVKTNMQLSTDAMRKSLEGKHSCIVLKHEGMHLIFCSILFFSGLVPSDG